MKNRDPIFLITSRRRQSFKTTFSAKHSHVHNVCVYFFFIYLNVNTRFYLIFIYFKKINVIAIIKIGF